MHYGLPGFRTAVTSPVQVDDWFSKFKRWRLAKAVGFIGVEQSPCAALVRRVCQGGKQLLGKSFTWSLLRSPIKRGSPWLEPTLPLVVH